MPQSRATTDPFQEVFDEAAAALMALGIPRIPAKIAIALLLSDTGRLTTLDLTQRLAVSPAAISSGVNYLSTAGLVHVGTIRGARRHAYQLVNDPPWLATALDRTAALSRLAAALHAASGHAESNAQQRITEASEYTRLAAQRDSATYHQQIEPA